MKIKTIIDQKDIYDIVRFNPNTVGNHVLISDGKENDEKRDYSNLILLTLMLKRGFFSKNYEQMINESNEFVSQYEKDEVMGL